MEKAMKLLLCSCDKSQNLDRDAIEKATGLPCSRVYNALCTNELGEAATAMQNGDTIIACGQEAPVFENLSEELELETPLLVDIRDRAGWSDESSQATPKVAALLAEAMLPTHAAPMLDIPSEGMCLILGDAATAIPAAQQLSAALSVTVICTDTPDMIPTTTREFDVMTGKLRSAAGSLGRFEVIIDALSTPSPAGRGTLTFRCLAAR